MGRVSARIGSGGSTLGDRILDHVLKQVAALFRVGTLTGLTDGALLDRFRRGPAEEAEAAFAALVDRHGPMVMQVCRRILGDRHDAEDAAQATFLVLARQARAIRRGDSVASWLYGAAARVAGRARRDAARRRARERRARRRPWRSAGRVRSEAGVGPEAWPELYEELGRLPDRFRLPMLLCHLEGLSYEQAAQRLGCPVRTVQSRLARAREKLRDRLTRRGVGPDPASGLAGRGVPARCLAGGCPLRSLETRNSDGGGPLCGGRDRGRLGLRSGRRTGRRSFESHDLATIVQMDGGPPADRRRRVRCGDGDAGPVGSRRSPSRAPPPSRTTTRIARTFKDGATVEVVAISTVPTGPNTWWKPDGSPLAEAPVDTIESQVQRARTGRRPG